MGKTIYSIVIIVAFSIISGFPLLQKGLHPTHDGEYHVVRFYEFDKVLRNDSLYPRWAPDLNNGYGVPLFNYVYPLPNYIASIFHFFGISFIDAFKLQMFFATIIGGIFFYLWAKHFWGEMGGVVSAIFYIFSPYRFVDIYIRGSIGEVWALALFPALLWSLTELIYKNKKGFTILSGVFLALIIFSHNILALMFSAFAFSYAMLLIYRQKEKKRAITVSVNVLFTGLSLSSIFWLPALLEKKYVVGLEIYSIANRFPELYQLLIPSWGSGFLPEDLQNQMSYQIGLGNLIAVLVSIFILIVFIKNKKNIKDIYIFFMFWFFLVFFLMLSISLPIWKIVPLMNYFQFPWRLLSLELIIASFLAGSLVSVWKSRILTIFMIIMAFSLGIGYTKPAYYHLRDDNYYITRGNFIDGTNSPGNAFNTIWFNRNLIKQNNKITFKNGSAEIRKQSLTTTNYVFDVSAKEATEATINTAYFPGWTVLIDKRKTDIKVSSDGLMSFPLTKGRHTIGIEFSDTLIRKISFFYSFLSLPMLFVANLIIFKILRK